jgi:uncharacterized membrane protein YkoI
MKIRTFALTAIALSAAATIAVASAPPGSPLKLAQVVAHMESLLPGEVAAIHFDGSGDKRPHYDVDVRLPQGAIARLEVDPATLQIAWRNPAIVDK